MKTFLKFNLPVFLAICGVIGTPATATATPVFVNAGFESSVGTTLTGWTTSGAGPQEAFARYACGGCYGFGYQGSKWAWLGNFEYGTGWIEQTLSGFTAGDSYTLSFLQASEYVSSETTTGTIAGAGTLSKTFTTTPSNTSSPNGNGYWNNFTAESWVFTASASSLTFRIAGNPGVPYDTGVDNFQLTANGTTVPEPASLAIFGLGLVGLLGFSRRRRSQSK